MQKKSKNPTSLHGKSPRENRCTSGILQHNKGSLQQAHSQYQLKWREIQSNSTKIRNNKGCTLSPYLLNIALEVLVTAIRQLKEINGI